MPDGVRFATKPAIAAAMARRAENAEVPFAWAAADSIYNVGELEMSRRRAGKGYVCGVASSHLFNSWRADLWISGTAPAIAQSLPADDDVRRSAGAAAKGSRLYDWAYLELADLDRGGRSTGWPGLMDTRAAGTTKHP